MKKIPDKVGTVNLKAARRCFSLTNKQRKRRRLRRRSGIIFCPGLRGDDDSPGWAWGEVNNEQ